MRIATVGLGLVALTAVALPRPARACTYPTSTSISAADSSLNDWKTGDLCVWQQVDAAQGGTAGNDILGFGISHSNSVNDTPNHFWFLRLRGTVVNDNIYRLDFEDGAGASFHMDIVCTGTGSPRTCTVSCTIDGGGCNPYPAGANNVIRAYALNDGTGNWAIELTRHSNQNFFDLTDNRTVTASVLNSTGSRTLDTTSPIPDYHSNGYVSATPVLLRSFHSHASASGALLSWETGSEWGTVGFFVRRGAPDGPRVNQALVPGRLTSPSGGWYSLADPAGSARTAYYLEEVSTRGTFVVGPARPTLAPPAPPARPPALREALPARRSVPTRPAQELLSSCREAFAHVEREGLYRLPATVSRTASAVPFSLSHAGRPVSVFKARSGELFFYAPAPSSPERPYDAYRLERASPSQRLVASVASGPTAGLPQRSFTSTTRTEKHLMPNPSAEPEDRFYWDFVLSGAPPKPFPFDLPGYLGGPVELTLHLHGLTDFPANEDHTATVQVGGFQAEDLVFGGYERVTYSVAIPDQVLSARGNTLLLGATASAEVPWDLIGLSAIEASYRRSFVALDDALAFTADAGMLVQVEGFSASPLVVDVTDPSSLTLVEPQTVAGRSPGVAVRFKRTGVVGQRRYYAAVPARAPGFHPSRAGEVPAQGADYVAVVGEGLSDALEPLLALRRSQGRSVASVPVEALYDKFAFGHHGPQAIRDFLLALSPRPREVLLAGRPSTDPRDYLGTGVPDLVPTYLSVSGNLRSYSPADAKFVAGPDGRTPFAAVGRLPVASEAELSAWVAKLVDYESTAAGVPAVGVFAADGFDSYGMAEDPRFRAESDLAASLVPSLASVKVHLPTAGKAELLAALAQGPAFVAYHGHAGPQSWSAKDLLETGDLAQLPAVRPFFLATVDCWDGMFALPNVTPLSVQLAQAPRGGAIGAIAPGSLLQTEHGALVDAALFPLLGAPSSVTAGDVIRGLHTELAKQSGNAQDLVFTYNLMGDPATRLPFR